MFIDINTIGSDGLTFERSVPLHGLEGPSREKIPDVAAHLAGRIKPAPGGAELTAELKATVPLTCSRCLETFDWDVDTDFTWRVVRNAPPAPKPDDEASILVAPEGRIGLEDLATEQVYLNLPLKPICTPGCRGLCPTCGTNRNLNPCACVTDDVDPRLAPLLPFRKKIQSS
jgi:uncharacterized protein